MIIDLRDYPLTPGNLDKLVERFEGVFLDEQERLGASIPGIFRDADDPDRFVWLRTMPDLATRARVLTAFYVEGELWRRHREEVNTWFVDTDDVLLLRPISEWHAPATGPSNVGMYTHVRRQPLTEAGKLQRDVEAAVAAAGGRMLVTLATDPAENNFPRHPIRTGDHGLVWFASFSSYRPLELETVVQRRLIPTTRSRIR